MKRDFWGMDGEIWGWNRDIISNFHFINGNGVPCGMHFKDRKELNKHKVDAKHIKKKKADGGEEGENNEVEAVAE